MHPMIPPPTMTTRDVGVGDVILGMLSFLPFAKRARRGCRGGGAVSHLFPAHTPLASLAPLIALRKGHCAYVAPLSTLTPGSSPGQALALSHRGCFAQLPSFPRRREPREKQSTPIKSPLPRAISLPLPGGD